MALKFKYLRLDQACFRLSKAFRFAFYSLPEVLAHKGKAMATILQFPAKDDHQWSGVASELVNLIRVFGATAGETEQLLKRLRPRWQALGQPFDIQTTHSLIGPLTAEQLSAFDQALRAQAAEITLRFQAEHGATLIEFAKLEFQLLRLQGMQP
jgi:hypothetical protein